MKNFSAAVLPLLLASGAFAEGLPKFCLDQAELKGVLVEMKETAAETPAIAGVALDASRSGDELILTTHPEERESCTYAGYCYACGYMPFKGKFGCGYAYHSSCSGHKTIRYEVKTYRRKDGTTYTQKREQSRSTCR